MKLVQYRTVLFEPVGYVYPLCVSYPVHNFSDFPFEDDLDPLDEAFL